MTQRPCAVRSWHSSSI